MIVGSASFIKAKEEYRVTPRRAEHECIDNVCHLLLPGEDRLAGAWVLIAGSKIRFNIGELRQGVVLNVREVRADRCNMRTVHHQPSAWARRYEPIAIAEIFKCGRGASI